MVGGGIEASGGESEIPISETRNEWKSDGQFFLVRCLAAISFTWYCESEWRMTGQKTGCLFLYPPSSSPILLALAACIYDKGELTT